MTTPTDDELLERLDNCFDWTKQAADAWRRDKKRLAIAFDALEAVLSLTPNNGRMTQLIAENALAKIFAEDKK
jgi:hypothetical protein